MFYPIKYFIKPKSLILYENKVTINKYHWILWFYYTLYCLENYQSDRMRETLFGDVLRYLLRNISLQRGMLSLKM